MNDTIIASFPLPTWAWDKLAKLSQTYRSTPTKVGAKLLTLLLALREPELAFIVSSIDGIQRMALGKYGKDMVLIALSDMLREIQRAIVGEPNTGVEKSGSQILRDFLGGPS